MHKFNLASCFLIAITGLIEQKIRYRDLRMLSKLEDWQRIFNDIEYESRDYFIERDYLKDIKFKVISHQFSMHSTDLRQDYYEANVTLLVKRNNLTGDSLCNFKVMVKLGCIDIEINENK